MELSLFAEKDGRKISRVHIKNAVYLHGEVEIEQGNVLESGF